MIEANVLSEARRQLLELGWRQGRVGEEGESHCAYGAIWYAVQALELPDEDERRRLLYDLSARVLEAAGESDRSPTDLTFWNDHPKRSAPDVLAAFDRAIANTTAQHQEDGSMKENSTNG